jgi:hypothetical protein
MYVDSCLTSKERSNRSCRFCRLPTLIDDKENSRILRGQLDSETTSILNSQNSGGETQLPISREISDGYVSHKSILFQFGVVSIGRVVAKKVDHDASDEGSNFRDKTDSSPTHFWVSFEDDISKQRKKKSSNPGVPVFKCLW